MVGKFEIGKDTAQVLAESAAGHVGRIASILSTAVREVTHEVGEWATDVFEMREAAARARADQESNRRPYPGDDFDDEDAGDLEAGDPDQLGADDSADDDLDEL